MGLRLIASPDDASVGTAIFERISSHNQRTRKSANVPSQIVSESILDEVDYQGIFLITSAIILTECHNEASSFVTFTAVFAFSSSLGSANQKV